MFPLKKIILIVFLVIAGLFINLSFIGSASFSAEKPKEITFAKALEPEATKPTVDYKAKLNKSLINFEHKINLKAKRSRFNGVVLVAYKDQILFEKAFGYKNPITKEILTTEVSFELASVSKQFTAASVLKLVELGQVDLSKPVAYYFPDFKFKTITIQHLLKHTSGLWDYMNMTEAYWTKKTAPNNNDVIKLVSTYQRGLNFTPGRRFEYSNTNYVILAALVEKLSGKSLDQFLQIHFFRDYCIDETYIGLNSRKFDHVATAFQPYRRSFLPLPPSFHNQAYGDKGVHATAQNLWMWFNNLKSQESLSKNSVELMFNLSPENNNFDYGMGFRTRESKTGDVEIYHDGLWDGFRNGLHFYPKQDLTLIVLSHTQNKSKQYFQSYLKRMAFEILPQ